MTKGKKIRLIIILAVVLLFVEALVACMIWTKTEWHRTVRCYIYSIPSYNENHIEGVESSTSVDILMDFNYPDDKRLDTLFDSIEIECDFTVEQSLLFTNVYYESVTIADREYFAEMNISNIEYLNYTWYPLNLWYKQSYGGRHLFPNDHIYISKDLKYLNVMIDKNTEEDDGYYLALGGCETVGEMKEAMRSFKILWLENSDLSDY